MVEQPAPPYHDTAQGRSPESTSPTVFIATPMYGGMATGAYAWSLAQTPVIFMRSGVGLLYQYRTSDALVANSRNHLATQFLSTDATHLMWIDADIGFNGFDIVSMLVADQDIVCGLYAKKAIDWERVAKAAAAGVPAGELHRHAGTFVVKPLAEGPSSSAAADGLAEIVAGGAGFMLIKRHVFETLRKHVPEYAFGQETVSEFYSTPIDVETRRLVSEDYYFCMLARRHGFKVFAAPWVRLTHTGPYEYGGDLEEKWLVDPTF